MGRDARLRARQFGRLAERVAVTLLYLKGYRILARNWRHPAGEIDIVAKRGRIVAFIEVKGRATEVGEPVSFRQRRRIQRAASAFAAIHPGCTDAEWRFDVLLVAPDRLPRHIVDAWRPDGAPGPGSTDGV